jgi:hypothetical protein
MFISVATALKKNSPENQGLSGLHCESTRRLEKSIASSVIGQRVPMKQRS